jgi:putative membrane-bound dehydrogenase-like protein
MQTMRFLGTVLLLAAAQDVQPPEESRRAIRLPEGFDVRLVAAEPDLVQPVSFAIDDRGRIWVAEMRSYPRWEPKDRILVLEDTDGDGRADRRSVFLEGLTYVTGIEVGFGGLWIIAPPRMLFVPDRDGDLRPDGEPVVLLDGFGTEGGHNIASGFTWGPDGWLYAGHGRTSISKLGKPGTPASERLAFDGGVWRYHPTRHVVEAFADGTTNPWGVAFNEVGAAFVSNCVDPHLYHAVQGAHFEPWRGRESSRFAYQRIATIADHLHWKGRALADSRGGREEQLAVGGGHAHCGTMVYLGDQFPEEYRGSVFMSNIHGHRINRDPLVRRGSGYAASHAPDFLVSRDPMFIGLSVQTGPDGAVYVSDWYDRGECHTRDPNRETGRLYKVVYKDRPSVRVDLGSLPSDELVRLQLHRNEWQVTHARRLLQERGPDPKVHEALRRILADDPDPVHKLRAVWALHATGAPLDPALLSHPDEHLRAWAVQLEMEDFACSARGRFLEMAKNDPSPVVRLHLASACRRMSIDERWDLVLALASHAEDAGDPNLPLMTWYAAEPMAERDRARALGLVTSAKIPLLRQFMVRRLAALSGGTAEAGPDAPAGTIAFASLAPRGWDLYVTDRTTGQETRLTDSPALDYNASFSPDGGRIAFVSEREGNAELCSIRPDGSDFRRLTSHFALDDHAAWSPDGQSILFTSTREAGEPGRTWNGLYRMRADGTGVERISPSGASDSSPAWYFWGDFIAFVSGGDLWVSKPDGTERRRVVENAGWPTFATNSRQIFFHSRRDGSWGIWRVNVDGSGLTRLSPKDVDCFTPRGVPRGSLLAVAVKRGPRRQIEILDLEKRALSPVTAADADHWNPSISPDGRLVAYHKATPGKASEVEPWATPPGTKLRMLRVNGSFPAFSDDGKRLALTGPGFGSVDVMDLDGSARRTLVTGSPRTLFSVAWKKDRIAYAHGGVFQGAEGQVDLAIVRPDGSDLRTLPGPGNDAFPAFSPDGTRLVFRSGRGGTKKLWTMKPDGSDAQPLTDGPGTDTMPKWSPAGDGIVFASDRDGEFAIWLVKPDGTGLRKLVGGGGRHNHPAFSPDGRWVVFTSGRAATSAEEVSVPSNPQPYGDLFAVRLDGGGLLRLTHNAFEEGTPAWGP